MPTLRTTISGLLLIVNGLISQPISPTVGVNNLGSTGLFFVPAPQTLHAGHLTIGLKNYLSTPVLNLNYPVHMAIGISDRTEFYASTNGYNAGALESLIDKGLGVKVNILQSKVLPLSVYASGLFVGQLRKRMISSSSEANECPACSHKLHRIHRRPWQRSLSKLLLLGSGYFHCDTCGFSSLHFYHKSTHLKHG